MNKVCCLLALLYVASASPQQARNVLIGFTEQPELLVYKQLVGVTYEQLGYKVRFVELVVERRLRAVEEGLVDAIVIGVPQVTRSFPDIIQVPVRLATGASYLICHKGLPCDVSVFHAADKRIMGTHRSFVYVQDTMDKPIRAQMLEFEKVNDMLELLEMGRVNYIIYTVDERGLPPRILLKFNNTKLLDVEGYHFVSRDFEHQVPVIAEALRQNLAALQAREEE